MRLNFNKSKRQSVNKYLVCRPLGGLNDCLCQVEYCRKLARKNNRTLLIQTETGNKRLSHRFELPFLEIFNFGTDAKQIKTITKMPNLRNEQIPPLYRPIQISQKISLDEFTQGRILTNKLKTKSDLKFDVEFHESAGGGLGSADLLQHVQLNENLFRELTRLSTQIMDIDYAIHFRAFDWGGGNLESLFEVISKIELSKKILIASDDNEILVKLRSEFPNYRFTSVSEIIFSLNIKLHQTELVVLELLLISLCRNIEIIRLHRKEIGSPKFSGFSRLAKHVWTVNYIQKYGVIKWAIVDYPFVGLAGSDSRIKNFIFLVFVEIPRLILQGKFPRGLYRQLNKINSID